MTINKKKVAHILFYLYIIFLFLFVVLKFDLNSGFDFHMIERIKFDRESGFWNINLIPFKTISYYITDFLHNDTALDIILPNLMGNIIAFIPMGFLLPKVLEAKFYHSIIICILIIIFIELFQFVTMIGFFDVDDIILNTLGCIVGYASHKILKFFVKKSNKCTDIN